MHLSAANAISERKRQFHMMWLNSQPEMFFCSKCGNHLKGNLEELPVEIYSSTNVTLLYHSWKLHEMVNDQLNKPASGRLTYPQVYEKYFGKPLTVINAVEEEEEREIEESNNQAIETANHNLDQWQHENAEQIRLIAEHRRMEAMEDAANAKPERYHAAGGCKSCGGPMTSDIKPLPSMASVRSASRQQFSPKNSGRSY